MNDFMNSNETENTPDVDNNMRIVFSVLKSQMNVQCAMCNVQTFYKQNQ